MSNKTQHWATSTFEEKGYRKGIQIRSKIKLTLKWVSGLGLAAIFIILLMSESSVQQHDISKGGNYRIASAWLKSWQTPTADNKEILDELQTTAAYRSKTSFLNLSAGCTSDTRWLIPKESNPIKIESPEASYYMRNWVSYPPVKGNYLDKSWEGARISVRTVGSETLRKEQLMNFSDALKILHEGGHVIWYHPRMLEEDAFTLEELRKAVLDKILLEKEIGGAAYYLAELPEFSGLANMERNIYYTKLNHTQSCIKFDKNILEKFYSE